MLLQHASFCCISYALYRLLDFIFDYSLVFCHIFPSLKISHSNYVLVFFLVNLVPLILSFMHLSVFCMLLACEGTVL